MSTYNGERFLPEQLRSLAGQTHLPYELVVADDGSTDGTWPILEEFAARAPFPVRLTRNHENLGYGPSFLGATRRASGRLLAFCDQDDVWHPDKLVTAAKVVAATGASLFVHTARLIDEAGVVSGQLQQGISRDEVRPPLTHGPWSYYYGFSMVFTRELFGRVDAAERGPHTMEHTGALSHDLWVHFLGTNLADTAVHRRPLADYRRHRRNVTPPVSLRTMRALTSSLGQSASRELGRDATARHRATVLRELSRTNSDPSTAERADRAAAHWERVAEHEAARIELYESRSALKRASQLRVLAAAGAYRSQRRAALGGKLLVKDALAGVAGLRRRDPTTSR